LSSDIAMKAIAISSFGGPDVMTQRDMPKPAPGPGQVLVRVQCAGVNFIDVYKRTGLYPSASLPTILGQEIAGVVEAVGEGVPQTCIGSRVAALSESGGYAEYAVVPETSIVTVPEGVTSELAAAVLLQGMTAHYLARSTYPLQRGDVCLVHAAAGGVGLLLVQLAKRTGATVFACVSSEEKAARARDAGADVTIDYTKEDFAARIRAETGGEGAHVVYDSVGQSTFHKSLAALRVRGMLVSFGQSSGPVEPFDIQTLAASGSVFLTRPRLGHYTRTLEELRWRAGDVFGLVASGELKVTIHNVYSLADAQTAHRDLESRKTSGKLLLSC
jgi:NADPH2:quinone reductase